MKTFATILLALTSLNAANLNVPDFSQNQKIGVQNTILCKVNGKTFSVLDVKKKMDLVFHQNYPQLADSNQAKYQFYQTSWRRALMEMIDNELILSDATDKEVKVTDGEVREFLEEKFGPNVIETLDKIGLTYEEAWRMTKEDIIVQRMNWWFIHSKAMSSVTPQDIKDAYRRYLQENPPYVEWKYRVISIRSNEPNDSFAKKIHDFLTQSGKQPETLAEELKKFEEESISIAVSNEYVVKDIEISETHKKALSPLHTESYSAPSFQMNRVENKAIYRIFYLASKTDYPAPSFEDLASQLKNDLTKKAILQQSQAYIGKLHKHYGFEPQNLVAENIQPFTLQ